MTKHSTSQKIICDDEAVTAIEFKLANGTGMQPQQASNAVVLKFWQEARVAHDEQQVSYAGECILYKVAYVLLQDDHCNHPATHALAGCRRRQGVPPVAQQPSSVAQRGVQPGAA